MLSQSWSCRTNISYHCGVKWFDLLQIWHNFLISWNPYPVKSSELTQQSSTSSWEPTKTTLLPVNTNRGNIIQHKREAASLFSCFLCPCFFLVHSKFKILSYMPRSARNSCYTLKTLSSVTKDIQRKVHLTVLFKTNALYDIHIQYS